MNRIRIVTDSTSDLSDEIYQKIGADIISLKVTFGPDTYTDRVDIDSKKLYELVEEKKVLPKTAAPSLSDFTDCFKKHLDDGEDIIFCGISASMSSSYNDAIVAAASFSSEEQKRIRCVDSKSLSSGIGLVLCTIFDEIQKGKTLEEVYQIALNTVDRVNAEFVVDTMEYLYKGGRCTGVSYFFGTALHLHPIIRVEHGGMVVHRLTRGKISKGCDLQIDEFKKQFEDNNIVTDHIFVTSSLGGEDSNAYILNIIRKMVGNKEAPHVVSTMAGSIISSHCGKATTGLLYITKRAVIK